VELQLAEAYERDFSRYTDCDGRDQRLSWLQQNPVAERRASGAFRLDVSELGGNDVIVDKEALLSRELVTILKARGSPTARAYSDIDHLLAHHMSGADAFVTVDQSTILNHKNALAAHGITVLTPAEAVSCAAPS
jgi:hypothetical protein